MGNLIDTDGLALYDEEYVQPFNDLSGLNDVDVSSPSNRQILQYNGVAEKWENSDFIDDTQKMIAPVEDEATASQPYAVGDQIIHNDFLYKVTQTIAQGGTLNPASGGNIELADKIVEQLKSLFDEEGDLSALTTTAKSSLVDAINELVGLEDILKKTSDVNDLNAIYNSEPGIRFYIYSYGASRSPSGSNGGYLIDLVRAVDSTYHMEIQIAFPAEIDAIYMRKLVTGTWPTTGNYGWTQIWGSNYYQVNLNGGRITGKNVDAYGSSDGVPLGYCWVHSTENSGTHPIDPNATSDIYYMLFTYYVSGGGIIQHAYPYLYSYAVATRLYINNAWTNWRFTRNDVG